MFCRSLIVLFLVGAVIGAPQKFETKKFKVGIEYEHSLPINGGSDRYRHRNNYDPFFVTVTATAKKGYVISYLEVKATVDEFGEVDFHVVRGGTGSRSLVFQLVSNHSDFLSYSYLAYGIKEEEYKKITNIISLPLPTNNGAGYRLNIFNFALFILLYPFLNASFCNFNLTSK